MPTRGLNDRSHNASRPLAVVVLAAGEGKRFKSKTPKVLHALSGKPLVGHVLAAVEPLAASKTVLVIGRGADDVKTKTRQLTKRKPAFAIQERPIGTADAAKVGDEALGTFRGDVLVVPGDSPLLTTETLQRLIDHHRTARAAATPPTTAPAHP